MSERCSRVSTCSPSARRRLGQKDDELLAAVAGDAVGRAQRLADHGRERLQRLVAGAVAELVVEALEVVDVEQPDRELAAAALEARALDLERLHQAAPVGDLRQLIGRDLVGEALHLVLELDHALRQVGRLAVLLLQPLLRLLDERSARRGSPRPSRERRRSGSPANPTPRSPPHSGRRSRGSCRSSSRARRARRASASSATSARRAPARARRAPRRGACGRGAACR